MKKKFIQQERQKKICAQDEKDQQRKRRLLQEEGYAAERDKLRKRSRLIELGYWEDPGTKKGKPKMPGVITLKRLFHNNKELLASVGWEEEPPSKSAQEWAANFLSFWCQKKQLASQTING